MVLRDKRFFFLYISTGLGTLWGEWARGSRRHRAKRSLWRRGSLPVPKNWSPVHARQSKAKANHVHGGEAVDMGEGYKDIDTRKITRPGLISDFMDLKLWKWEDQWRQSQTKWTETTTTQTLLLTMPRLDPGLDVTQMLTPRGLRQLLRFLRSEVPFRQKTKSVWCFLCLYHLLEFLVSKQRFSVRFWIK